MQLANNPRTTKNATIKRASARARLNMNRLDRNALNELEQLYRRAGQDIKQIIGAYADTDGSLRLTVLNDIQTQVNSLLGQISDSRNAMLNSGLNQASTLGVQPYTGYVEGQTLSRVADDAVRFTRSFVAADGLQLSDRLWRVDNHAKNAVGNAIENAIIQGKSASEAANDFLSRGEPVPSSVRNKLGIANADKVGRLASSALLTGSGSPRHNVLRVFRTELNRAHGEAYMASGEEDEDFGGWKYLLSPRHPEPDICDMHSSVNKYGLGPGVYPSRQKTPWPAHPNTLSYTEIVFKDEITAEDKAGKLSRIEWLKGQTPGVQKGVLGANQKRAALQKNILNENEISTPWHKLKKRYERRGINTDLLVIKKPPAVKLKGTQIIGMNPAAFKQFTDNAVKSAPKSVVKLINKAPKPNSFNITNKKESYYTNKSITLSKSHMKKQPRIKTEHDVYLHEYGHFIDFNVTGKQLSLLPNSEGGINDSINSAGKSLYAKTQTEKTRRITMKKHLFNADDLSLADLFGSLTKNKVGFGHSNDYLSNPGFSETEVFANMFNLYTRYERSGWDYFAKELPGLANDFITLIERLSK